MATPISQSTSSRRNTSACCRRIATSTSWCSRVFRLTKRSIAIPAATHQGAPTGSRTARTRSTSGSSHRSSTSTDRKSFIALVEMQFHDLLPWSLGYGASIEPRPSVELHTFRTGPHEKKL